MTRNRAIPGDSEWVLEQALRPATEAQRRTDRVRSWRRRVLQRRGALMHARLARESEQASLAMLDETGVVVSWYGEVGASSEHVVDRHISQFYLAKEIASNQPLRDLRSAAVSGSVGREGWRRRTDGTTVWSRVVIEAVLLRDERLQGFSYLMRAATHAMRAATQRIARPVAGVALLLGLSICAAVPIAAAPTVAAPSGLPDHARASRYGSGWDCIRGFRLVGDTCVQIVVPANAFLEASGSSWRCDRGYLNVNERCVAIQVPPNAYLDDVSGKGWSCDRKFREGRNACVPIEVPANAHASGSSYGPGWECDRGWRVLGSACAPVTVPARGFLSRSGDNWECERGFRKDDAACVAVQLPANAHLDYSGSNWTCDDGFHTHGTSCAAD